MPKGEYEIFEALDPLFEVVMEVLRGLVNGDHLRTIGTTSGRSSVVNRRFPSLGLPKPS
jgi:hypothetical protein